MRTSGRRAWCLVVVVGTLVVSCGQRQRTEPLSTTVAVDTTASAAPVPETTAVPETTTAPDTIAPETTAGPDTTVADTVDDEPQSNSSVVPADPADEYLERTTEVYRRTLPDGRDFVVRLSTDSYADVFGMQWNAPTGSAEECLGDHAVFLGVPRHVESGYSAWRQAPWHDAIPAQPVVVQTLLRVDANAPLATQYFLMRTGVEASQIVLASAGNVELDRADVIDGLAMLTAGPQESAGDGDWSELHVVTVSSDGQSSAPLPLIYETGEHPEDCGPGPAPIRPLPEAGAQPADPAAAEAAIRQRHALLVDLSVPGSDKPADLLDDNTGVDDAVARLESGQYGEVAKTATYSINELVFTKPDEAWFRYTLTTETGTFPDGFGIARFNGDVWQITRATLCQDLALGLAPCQPTPDPVELPLNPEWEAASREWMSQAMLYSGNDGCAPLEHC